MRPLTLQETPPHERAITAGSHRHRRGTGIALGVQSSTPPQTSQIYTAHKHKASASESCPEPQRASLSDPPHPTVRAQILGAQDGAGGRAAHSQGVRVRAVQYRHPTDDRPRRAREAGAQRSAARPPRESPRQSPKRWIRGSQPRRRLPQRPLLGRCQRFRGSGRALRLCQLSGGPTDKNAQGTSRFDKAVARTSEPSSPSEQTSTLSGRTGFAAGCSGVGRGAIFSLSSLMLVVSCCKTFR